MHQKRYGCGTNRQRAVDASEDDVGNDLDPTYME